MRAIAWHRGSQLPLLILCSHLAFNRCRRSLSIASIDVRISAILLTPPVSRASAIRPVERELSDEPLVEVPRREQKRHSQARKDWKDPARSALARSSSAVQAALTTLRRGG